MYRLQIGDAVTAGPHTVTLDVELLRALCAPVRIHEWGEPHEEVAALIEWCVTHRVALVMAGTKGIGRGCADRLGEAGFRVAVCARTGADVIYLCAPNNPTGKVFTRGELEQIAALSDGASVCSVLGSALGSGSGWLERRSAALATGTAARSAVPPRPLRSSPSGRR